MIKEKFNLSKDDDKMLKKVFWRTMTLSATYNYERMQGLGYVYSMIPVIDRYYTDKQEKIDAYKRHFELFNTTPTMGGFITGLTASMEREAAQNQDFDKSSISAVKLALMGPFAGIGDSLFWGSLRIISLGIGISFAAQGSILGAILHLLIFNLVAFFFRYYGVYLGFGQGSAFIKDASQNGLLGLVTKAAGIVGLMTVGAMTCSMVKLKTPLVLNFQGTELAIQSIFDGIFPNILPLLLTFLCFKLVNKGVKPVWIMLGFMVAGVLGKMVGIF